MDDPMAGHIFALGRWIGGERSQQCHAGRGEKGQRKSAGCAQQQQMPGKLCVSLHQQDGSGRREREDNIAAAAIAVDQHTGQQISGKMRQRVHAHHPPDEGRPRPQRDRKRR
ncbi:hypothetical protein D3C75_891890 [compost metagenome]